MRNNGPLRINLASDPLRNKRLFRSLLAVLLILLAGVALPAGGLFVHFQVKGRNLAAEVEGLRKSMETARVEAKRFATQTRELARKEKAKVDFTNDIIYRKSFSWVGLLSQLEEALPARSAVTSLAPTFAGGSKAEVTLTAVFQNWNDMMTFISQLYARRFSRIRIHSEGKTGYGWLEAEIAVVYEGTR